MITNFELLMDFKNVRDFAICMSKNNICCHKANCYVEVPPEKGEEECRRCWLDFLTGNEGLDLSYLDKEEPETVEDPHPITTAMVNNLKTLEQYSDSEN